ncbi:hypothetical protein [Nonomuraea insulae]|uniref:Uncharacterized protein n=1 Tax=Nonomuraea insulae TaxID=1616787 RepID=A0ABW1D8X1_9ACTN
MTEPEDVFQAEVIRRHELPYARPLVGAKEPETTFQREVVDRYRQPGTAQTDSTPEGGGRALASPTAQAIAADRAWLAKMMAARRTTDDS